MNNNLMEIESRLKLACERSKRNRADVTLIAVSKTQPIERLLDAYALGIREFGENKVQEIRDKYVSMPDDVHFHMIGHLQTNKVKYIVDKCKVIHSVDSLKLAQVIDKEAAKKNVKCNVLIEVNVSGEESKFGLDFGTTLQLVEEISRLKNVQVNGLMTVAPFCENPEDNRLIFRALKQLSVDINNKNLDNVTMNVLSMGMTNDFEIAVEEGATMVRIGTAIFGKRD